MATCVLAGRLAANLAHPPQISLAAGIAIWFADMLLALLFALHPLTARLSLPVASLFFPMPIFLDASPLSRFALMVLMGVPFIIAIASCFAPPKPGRWIRLAFFFSWFGTKTIEPRARNLDLKSLLQFVIAAVVFAAALAMLRTAAPAGPALLVRWLACGIAIFSLAEMITASHGFLTALLGLDAPSLMRSPFLSASVNEFWTRRWNVAMSELGFRPLLFAPLARHGMVPALFAAFGASAVAHALVCFVALGRWPVSLAFGALLSGATHAHRG